MQNIWTYVKDRLLMNYFLKRKRNTSLNEMKLSPNFREKEVQVCSYISKHFGHN